VTAAAWGRRPQSLRTRLLAGLIGLTAVFLVVMGAVSIVVLRALEQNQSNTELRLAARQSVQAIAQGNDGFAAAYLSLRTGATGELTPPSATAAELRALLSGVAGEPAAQVTAYLNELAGRGQPFDLALHGSPALRAAWRPVTITARQSGLLPPGAAVVLIGRPAGAAGSHVRGLVFAELITGAVLLALLAVCGNWLIGRGLAPLDRMARAADMITSSGDLAARMPGAGGRQETGRLAAAINTMLDRIQHAFGARLRSEQKVRQFAADASHEMRTPLTTIRGYAELCRQGAFGPDELPNAMRRIEQEADRMSMLVAELLELARLDRAASLDLTETDLAILARDAVADALAVEPDRAVSAQVPPSLVVTADESRIRQVLANLLGNVRAHTPPGTAATVRLYSDRGGAVLEVSDEGPGMSAQDASRAFDRFHRGGHANGAATASRPGHDGAEAAGSGLGLSIVRAIAAAHGGQARLQSAPGAGTTVQLWIPARNPHQLSRTDGFFAPAPLLPLPAGDGHPVDGAPGLVAVQELADPRVAAVQPLPVAGLCLPGGTTPLHPPGHDGRVELRAPPRTSQVHRPADAIGPVQHLDGVGEVEQPHRRGIASPAMPAGTPLPSQRVNTCWRGPHTSLPSPSLSAMVAVVRQWDISPRSMAAPFVASMVAARRSRCGAELPAPTWRSENPSMDSPALSTPKLSCRKAMSSPNQTASSGVSATQPVHPSIAT
jgi:signal transduction histidine kinase